MSLELLKLVMRIDSRVAIIEPHRKSDVDDAIAHAVDPRSAKRVRIERPAHRVNHRAGREPFIGHFPELFDSNRVNLRIAVAVELETRDQLLREGAANALAQHCNFRNDVNARFEIRFLVAVLVDPFVAGANPDDRLAVIKHFRAGKFGKDVYAGRFALLAKPSYKLVERDYKVAVILKRRWQNWQRKFSALRQEVDMLFTDRSFKRRAFLLESGDQFPQA